MWYYIRYAYNLMLAAFLVIGFALLSLGTVVIVLAGIAVAFDAGRFLFDYELLLTETTLGWSISIGLVLCGLGAVLGLLGLNATDPNFLKKMMDREKHRL